MFGASPVLSNDQTSEENKNMKSKLIALSVCAATATCLAGRQLLPEGFAPDPSSFALLPHDHSFYWAAMAASTNWYQDLMMNEVLVRTNDVLSFEREYPIDTNMTMCAFFSSERELTLREGVLALIWDEEGTNALPFFASVISSPGWPFSDRFCAYRHLSDVPRYWEEEPRHGMTSNEVSAIRETIESVMHAETNWSCRTECDRFFLATDPVWKTSEVRRAYLEETLLRAGSDPLQIWNTQNRLNKLSTPYDPEYLDYMRRNNIML